MLHHHIVFDLETSARADAIPYLPAPDAVPETALEPEADRRLTDPVKIAADLERKRAKAAADLAQQREDAIRKQADRINGLALNANGCEIVAT